MLLRFSHDICRISRTAGAPGGYRTCSALALPRRCDLVREARSTTVTHHPTFFNMLILAHAGDGRSLHTPRFPSPVKS